MCIWHRGPADQSLLEQVGIIWEPWRRPRLKTIPHCCHPKKFLHLFPGNFCPPCAFKKWMWCLERKAAWAWIHRSQHLGQKISRTVLKQSSKWTGSPSSQLSSCLFFPSTLSCPPSKRQLSIYWGDDKIVTWDLLAGMEVVDRRRRRGRGKKRESKSKKCGRRKMGWRERSRQREKAGRTQKKVHSNFFNWKSILISLHGSDEFYLS